MNQGEDIELNSSDSTYVLRDDDMSDSSSDCLLYDDIDDTSSDDERLPYFTPQHVPDNMVPFSDNIFSRSSAFQPSAIFTAQLQLHNLFNRNKGSLKMYDDMIDILNTFMGTLNNIHVPKFMHHTQFLQKVENNFNTAELKPTYGSVCLHNGSLATVPVFDMKTMILSILHDESLMRDEHFAPGMDIFTGEVDKTCSQTNDMFGEIHTGDAWTPAVQRFCGTEKKYMPLVLNNKR